MITHGLVLLLALSPTASAGPLQANSTWATDSEEVLVELRIGRVASRLVVAYRHGDTALLPAHELLDLGEVGFTLDDAGTLEARRQPGNRSVVVEAEAGRAWVDGVPLEPERHEIRWLEGVLYLSTDLLGSLFDLEIRTHWGELVSLVVDPDALPLGRRLAREARWGALRDPRTPPAADLTLSPAAHRIGGLVGDWSLSAQLTDPEATAMGQLVLGTRILGGALRVSGRSPGPIRDGEVRAAATYHRVWLDNRFLSQLRLGDGLSTGPRPRGLRGVSLTNAPSVRDPEFGAETFEGRLGPGWDIELRRHGRTVDVSRADEQGAFALDIPLRYGANEVQVVAFGPHGEVVTMERLVLLGQDRLPAGRLEWALSGGRCDSARCHLTGNADVRYGVSRRWTLRAGAEAFLRDSVPSALRPYVGVSGSLGPWLSLFGEGMPGVMFRAGAHVVPSPRFRVRVAGTGFHRDADMPHFFHPGRRSNLEGDLFLRPLGTASRWTVRASGVRENWHELDRTRWQARSGIRLGNVLWEAGLRGVLEASRSGGSIHRLHPGAGAMGPMPVRVAGTRPWLRVDAEWDGGELFRVESRLAQQISRSTRLEIGGGWTEAGGGHLTMSFSIEVPAFRSVTQVRHDERAGDEVVQLAQGSFRWDEAVGGIGVGPTPGMDRAGLSGFVYLDEDESGRWEPGEALLPGVQVVVGGRTVVTDEHGRYRVWDLLPRQPTRVAVHEPSLSDPRWLPEHRIIEVRLAPASYGRLDLRVIPAGELAGRIVQSRGGRRGSVGLGGIEISLHELASDREVARFTTFSDGSFYGMGLRSGTYRLRVDPAHLARLGSRTLVEFALVDVDAGVGTRQELVLHLLPATMADRVGRDDR